jgi:outer membrane protein
MLNELKTLEEAYQKDLQNERQVLSQEKEKDILQKRKRIEEYSANADKELTARKEELYHPIRTKMQSAIDKVAVQLKYDYVLDASYGNIIYRRNEQDDILKDVLKELGL